MYYTQVKKQTWKEPIIDERMMDTAEHHWLEIRLDSEIDWQR